MKIFKLTLTIMKATYFIVYGFYVMFRVMYRDFVNWNVDKDIKELRDE